VEAFSAPHWEVQHESKDVILSWQASVDYEDGTPLDPNDILGYELEALLADACEDGEWFSCEDIYSWVPESMVLVSGTYYYVYEVYMITLDSSEEIRTFEDVPDFDWVLSMRTIMKNELVSRKSDYVILNRGFFATTCINGQETICLTN
jgi:hypothetical protein